MYLWFGMLCTIQYFIIFCKIVKTGTAYAESSFLAGLQLWDFKKLGLRFLPWARIQSRDSNSDSAPLIFTTCFAVNSSWN